jgi:hypothetical protein
LFFLAADCAAKNGRQQEPFGGGTKEMKSHEIAEHATKAVEELAGALEGLARDSCAESICESVRWPRDTASALRCLFPEDGNKAELTQAIRM